MRSKTPDPIPGIRQALGIDTWGMDLYRLKRRIGELVQRAEAAEARLAALECNRLRPGAAIALGQPEPPSRPVV